MKIFSIEILEHDSSARFSRFLARVLICYKPNWWSKYRVREAYAKVYTLGFRWKDTGEEIDFQIYQAIRAKLDYDQE